MDSLKRGRTLEETMYLAYMKNTSTAAVYSKGLKVLFPIDFYWRDAGIGNAQEQLDEKTLSEEMQAWKAFLPH